MEEPRAELGVLGETDLRGVLGETELGVAPTRDAGGSWGDDGGASACDEAGGERGRRAPAENERGEVTGVARISPS